MSKSKPINQKAITGEAGKAHCLVGEAAATSVVTEARSALIRPGPYLVNEKMID